MKLRKRWIFFIPALVLAFFAGACASKPFLKVQYQLPSPSSTLDGKQVSVTVSDMRIKEALVTETARKSLRDFKGTFSLVVLRDDGSGNLRGAYDLVSLFSEVFQQRLKNEGIQATTGADSSLPELKIEITEFQIDFVNRKWIVAMNYRASLIDNGILLSKESVGGQAERLKVMGKKGAEKILSELLTDVVNKLNLVGLFQQARL
ncbi:MAG: hypothetical protein V2J65_27465 [Desulfobacteraceae bacterium]|jgi:hypothetical protein|nr:hypothetical protein [Desulfobacteraceae bacterium]